LQSSPVNRDPRIRQALFRRMHGKQLVAVTPDFVKSVLDTLVAFFGAITQAEDPVLAAARLAD
jgi:hypothetical protein